MKDSAQMHKSDFSGLHVLTGTEYQSLIHFTKWSLFFRLPYPPAFQIKPQHSEVWWGWWCWKASIRTKLQAPTHWASFKPGKETEEGKKKKLQNKIVTTSKSAHPVKFPSFFLSLLFLNLASKDKGSQEQYRLYLHNPKCQNVDVFLCT